MKVSDHQIGFIVLNAKKEKGVQKRRERKKERRGSERESDEESMREIYIDGRVSG